MVHALHKEPVGVRIIKVRHISPLVILRAIDHLKRLMMHFLSTAECISMLEKSISIHRPASNKDLH